MAGETATTGTEKSAAEQAVEELLTDARTKMESELEELRPQHEAFLRLEQILSNFDTITSGKPARKSGTSGTRAPRGSRSAEFLAIVKASGDQGVRVADAAEQMEGINPNYLYRIGKELMEEGLVRRDENKRFYAVAESNGGGTSGAADTDNGGDGDNGGDE